MDVNIIGLKCDYCDYRDDSVQFSEYKDSIGKKCPKCDNVLLTQAEYDSCLKIYKAIEIINKISNVFKFINPMFYYRLIFGDKRNKLTIEGDFPNRKK